MKTLGLLFRFLLISCFISLTACSSSKSESVEDVMDESTDNQITSNSEEPIDSEIPSPEQVAAETAAAENEVDDQTDGTLAPEPMAAGDQLEIDSIIQTEEAAQQQLDKRPSTQAPAVVEAPPAEETDSGLMGMSAPTMADVAAETDEAAPTAKAKRGKVAKNKSPGRVSAKKGKKPRAEPTRQELADGSYKVYIVQPGDTLGAISRVLYGTSRRWNDLMQVNGLNIKGAIYPGDTLKYTADNLSADYEAKWEGLSRASVVVEKGDTLAKIAERTLGSKAYWKLLWRWNESIVSDPHTIAPGLSLNYVSKEDLSAFFTGRKSQASSH